MRRMYSHPGEYRKIFLANYLCIGFVPGGMRVKVKKPRSIAKQPFQVRWTKDMAAVMGPTLQILELLCSKLTKTNLSRAFLGKPMNHLQHCAAFLSTYGRISIATSILRMKLLCPSQRFFLNVVALMRWGLMRWGAQGCEKDPRAQQRRQDFHSEASQLRNCQQADLKEPGLETPGKLSSNLHALLWPL